MSDLISRKALIEEFKKWLPKEGSEWLQCDIHPLENLSVSAILTIEEQPTVEAKEVVHGEWIDEIEKFMVLYKCSECSSNYPWKTNFCPNCGADMREKKKVEHER